MDEDTYTITGKPLKQHEYVTIKRYLTAADEAWVNNHAMTMTGDKKNPQMQMTLGDVRLAMLKRMIVTWGLTRKVVATNGTVSQVAIPCTHQEIEKLPVRISDYIHEAINKLDEEDEEEGDEDFLPDADGPLESGESSLTPMKISRRRA